MKKLISLLTISGLISVNTTNLMNVNETMKFNINEDKTIYAKPQMDIVCGIDENSFVGYWSTDTYDNLSIYFDKNDSVYDNILPFLESTLIRRDVTNTELENSTIYIKDNWSNMKLTMDNALENNDCIEFVYSNNSINNIRGIHDATDFSYSTELFSDFYTYNNALTLSYAGFASANDFLNSKSTFLLDRIFEVYVGYRWKWYKWNTDFQNRLSVSTLKPYLNKKVTICDYTYNNVQSPPTEATLQMSITDNTTYKDLELNFDVSLYNNNLVEKIGAKMHQ